MNYSNNNRTIYTSLPQINELCCVICEIDLVEIQDSSAKSNFHWQTMKCRLLIHLVPDIIASPVLGTERVIFVVMSIKYFKAKKLGAVLRSLKLIYQGLRPVTHEVYKACLIYTIQCKMAPNWNKIGEHLVRGKYFYTLVQTIEALKLDIYIDEKGVCLQFQTEKVKIPHVELQDFYLPQSILAHFLADSKGYIDLSKYNLPFIHVLPSTKKARILSVSKEIPARCPFQNYDQLRRHWKNMYGYTLPKNKDEVFYYEIKFPMPKSIIYTYPNVCIMAGPVNVIHTRDCEPTINHFLTDMLNLLPNIFGKQFQISHYKTVNTESVATYTLPIMCPILSENKELLTQSGKQNDPSSSLKLQFSAMCGDRLPYTDNAVPTSLIKTDLAKIHHIHNTVLTANANCTLNNQNINSTQNDISISSVSQTNHWTAQTVQGAFNSSKDSTKCDINESVKEEESISKYFKRQKSRHLSNSLQEQFTQKGKLKNVTLKQKLLNNMCDGSKPVLLQNAEYHVDVEVMAKNNKLGEVKNSVLSNWLKERFIPHNPQAKKAELINKVLSHMRNTQMLKQFRM